MRRMLKAHLNELILALQWGFMFAFSSIGGVVANECYLIITNPQHKKWNNIIPKIILALFLCSLAHTYYVIKEYDPRFENVFIALCGFLHFQLGSYIIKDLFPLIGNMITQVINRGGKKND